MKRSRLLTWQKGNRCASKLSSRGPGTLLRAPGEAEASQATDGSRDCPLLRTGRGALKRYSRSGIARAKKNRRDGTWLVFSSRLACNSHGARSGDTVMPLPPSGFTSLPCSVAVSAGGTSVALNACVTLGHAPQLHRRCEDCRMPLQCGRSSHIPLFNRPRFNSSLPRSGPGRSITTVV